MSSLKHGIITGKNRKRKHWRYHTGSGEWAQSRTQSGRSKT